MMKGTASIHLHASIRNTAEVPRLLTLLTYMAKSEDFKMLSDRRDIWNKTDFSRCGMPYGNFDYDVDQKIIIDEIVRVALNADDISENKPFYMTNYISFESFLYHLTTIFADVRLNMKGPTLELRTLDSMPVSRFKGKWKKFISMVKEV